MTKPSQAVFHQNGIGEPELKFIHTDGREVVYDGDGGGAMITDDVIKGTFNYDNATISNHPNPGVFPMIENVNTEGSRLHKAYDIDPWIVFGNTRSTQGGTADISRRQSAFNAAVVSGRFEGAGNSIENIIAARRAIPVFPVFPGRIR